MLVLRHKQRLEGRQTSRGRQRGREGSATCLRTIFFCLETLRNARAIPPPQRNAYKCNALYFNHDVGVQPLSQA